MAFMPTIYEQTARGERGYDVFSRLLKDRIIFLGWPIDDTYANLIIAQLLFLDAEDPEKDLYLYVNSPGIKNHHISRMQLNLPLMVAGVNIQA